ncbi:MAG: hypothetical protein P8R54_26710 [Myxococcota bacterium]|nr:hypothetical protein [Myxococcota bacterium]
MPTRRAQILAVLILAHLAQITISSVPLPKKAITDLKPRHRQAIVSWGTPLLALGLARSEDDLVADAVRLNNAIVSTRSEALSPLFRWQKRTGTQQSWRMFGDVPAYGGRLQLHARTGDGPWLPLFEDHSDADWMADLLTQGRLRGVRSAYSTKVRKRRQQYRRLVTWLARHAATDFPQATEFRARYQKVAIGKPSAVRAQGGLKLGGHYWEAVVDLETLR